MCAPLAQLGTADPISAPASDRQQCPLSHSPRGLGFLSGFSGYGVGRSQTRSRLAGAARPFPVVGRDIRRSPAVSRYLLSRRQLAVPGANPRLCPPCRALSLPRQSEDGVGLSPASAGTGAIAPGSISPFQIWGIGRKIKESIEVLEP